MSEELSLLAAIRAERVAGARTRQRDNTTASLVYADWLEEHEQPLLAEFIRVQCGIEKCFYRTDPEGINERIKLEAREKELITPILWDEEARFDPNTVAGMWVKKLEELFDDRVTLASYYWYQAYHYTPGWEAAIPLFKGGIPTVAIKIDKKEKEKLPFASIFVDPGEFYGTAVRYMERLLVDRSSIVIDALSQTLLNPAYFFSNAYERADLAAVSEIKILGRKRSAELVAFNLLASEPIPPYFLPNLERLEVISTVEPPMVISLRDTEAEIMNDNRTVINGLHRARPLENLKYLKLEGLNLPGSSLRYLCGEVLSSAKAMEGVERLDLSHNQLGYHNGVADANESPMPRNYWLNAFIGGENGNLWKKIRSLKMLDLSSNYLGGYGSYVAPDNVFTNVALASSLVWQLKELRIADNGFTPNTIRLMELSNAFRGLNCLDLSQRWGELTYHTNIRIPGQRGRS